MASKLKGFLNRLTLKKHTEAEAGTSQADLVEVESQQKHKLKRKNTQKSQKEFKTKGIEAANIEGWASTLAATELAAAVPFKRGGRWRVSRDSGYLSSFGQRQSSRRNKSKKRRADGEKPTEGTRPDVLGPKEMSQDSQECSTSDDDKTNAVAEMVKNHERRQIYHTRNAETNRSESEDCSLRMLPEIYKSLRTAIKEEQIPYFSIHQDTSDKHQIVIRGCKVESIHDKLCAVLTQPHMTAFSISTKNITIDVKQFPSVKDWVHIQKAVLADKNQNSISQTALLLKGFDTRRYKKDSLDFYGATTAHSFMTKKQCDDLSGSGRNFSEVWSEIIATNWDNRPYLACPDGTWIDIVSRPFPVFRYWFPDHLVGEYSWLNDLAVFKIDGKHVADKISMFSECLASQQEGLGAAAAPSRSTSKIYQIESVEDLHQLLGKEITCKGRTGAVVMSPDVECGGWKFGLYLAFTLEGNQMLENGDCGSLVFLKTESREVNTILGMFFGTFTGDPLIHKAVVVSQALKQIEQLPVFHISNLDLIDNTEGSSHASSNYY